jgi:hypothetical protein
LIVHQGRDWDPADELLLHDAAPELSTYLSAAFDAPASIAEPNRPVVRKDAIAVRLMTVLRGIRGGLAAGSSVCPVFWL